MKNVLRLTVFSFVAIALSVSMISFSAENLQDSEAMRVEKCRATSKTIARFSAIDRHCAVAHANIKHIRYWYDYCSFADLQPGDRRLNERALSHFEERAVDRAVFLRKDYKNSNKSDLEIQEEIERDICARREAQSKRVEARLRGAYDKTFAYMQIGS